MFSADEYGRITIEASVVGCAVTAINRLTEGMRSEIFADTAKGVLKDPEGAEEFVLGYYDMIAGAIELIAVTTDIISAALVNDELRVVAPDPSGEAARKDKAS